MSFEQGSGRGGAPGLFHHPVGRGVAAFLDHQLHVLATCRAVVKFARFHLMEKSEGHVGLDHAGGLKRGIFVNAREFGVGGDVVDHPGGPFVTPNTPLTAK